jgi:hypothetical protein
LKKFSLVLVVLGILLVLGFSFSIQSKGKTKDDWVPKSQHETSPFVIKSIESQIATLKTLPSEEPLKGVIYTIFLYSNKDYTGQLLSMKFKLEGDTPIQEAMVRNVTPIMVDSELSNGYIYRLQFETIYRDSYTDEELQTLKNDRNFDISIQKDGKKFYIPLETNK